MRIAQFEALDFGHAVIRQYLSMLKISGSSLTAKMARWLSPSSMTETWKKFLNHLIVLLPAGDRSLESFDVLKVEFQERAADAVRNAYDIDPDQERSLFMERVKRNLGLVLHEQRRYAFFKSTQAHRLRIGPLFGPQGMPPQVRQAEVLLRSTERVDETHERYKFWERQGQQDRQTLFGGYADRPILDQRKSNHMEFLPAPRRQYAPVATRERLEAMTKRAVEYEAWVPPLTSP